MTEATHVETDVLVIGSGAAGMYAATAAAQSGAAVLLADRSLIGRGGATVMAQMTVAVALGSQAPDHWSCHLHDTLQAGRGLCDESLSRLLCEEGPECIRQMDTWGVGWAREDGRIAAAQAPGHDRPRCVYVDFLNTGPAVSKTLRAIVNKTSGIRKAGDLLITDLVSHDGEAVGATALHLASGAPVTIAAKATILATGGLTRLYRRNSASANMGGDGYALALRAGAPLTDMEFVQFFPIGHLAPRLIGMDPIMWDPFRYKLGGRLLNGLGQEFTSRYGSSEDGAYVLTRDLATYAIVKEVEVGRGSPHGGAYLSFTHCPPAELRAAFGPVIDRLATNGIDLTRMPVEVAPIAHYHMGGVGADVRMETEIPGLLVAGEAVGGANGANRLSGNAVTEALVFGRRAGRSAAQRVARITSQPFRTQAAKAALDLAARDGAANGPNSADMILRLQSIMADDVGPFRTAERLERAVARIADLAGELGERPFGDGRRFDMRRIDWFDLRNMLLVARVVAMAALRRTESRGAHQREDFPRMLPEWRVNQLARWRDGEIEFVSMPPPPGLPPPALAGTAIAYGAAGPSPDPRGGGVRKGGSAVCDRSALAAEGREGGTAQLRVWRGLAQQAGQFETYEVPFEPGQSVLDGLRWIRANHNPTLAIRFSCINANACKECMMEIDGITAYACTTQLKPGEMTLKPLPNKALVRDLVTEIAPPAERLGRK
ncbi:MAG TPA: FAD-binding protein [Xanthobacteraceae bacterium]|nr:FAD-binding protein [Xanthobacteraceae bacterium]